MRRISVLLLAVWWLAACSQQPAEIQTQATHRAMPATEPEVTETAPGPASQSVKVQAGQLELPFSFTERSDRMAVTSQTRVEQRQLRLEVESAKSIEMVLSQAEASLAALGYSAGEVIIEDDGGLRQHFHKDGVDSVRIRLNALSDNGAEEDDVARYLLYLTETAPIPNEGSN